MAHFRRHLIGLFACAALTTLVQISAPAQSPSADAAKGLPRQVSLRFTVFALGGAKGLAYEPRTGHARRPLKFYSAYRSPRYDYHGPVRIRFFDTEEADQALPVATYDVPEGAAGDLLLLFFPKEVPTAQGLKYDVYGIDDSLDRTPAGHFTTINVSGRDYVGQYGGNRIAIPQGVGRAHAGKGHLILYLATQIEGIWLPTGRHDFGMGARDRVTLIFYPPASGSGVYPIIRRLTDVVPGRRDESAADIVENP